MTGSPNRLRPGDVDTRFGTGGFTQVVDPDSGNPINYLDAVALDHEGRIQAGGLLRSILRGVVFRLTEDGVWDRAFGQEGLCRLPENPNLPVNYNAFSPLKIFPDGEDALIVVGRMRAQFENGRTYLTFCTCRILAGGVVDESFGENGLTIYRPQPFAYESNASSHTAISESTHGGVCRQADGSMYAASLIADIDGQETTFQGILKIRRDGALDPSFGTDGFVQLHDIDPFSGRYGIDVDPFGRLVLVGGSGPAGGQYTSTIARFRPDGTPDTLFGENGQVQLPEGEYVASMGCDVAILPDGKILVLSLLNFTDEPAKAGLLRFTMDGAPDLEFNNGKVVLLDYFASLLAVDDGGRALAVGNPNFVVARINANGTVDHAFGDDGIVELDRFAGRSIAIQQRVNVIFSTAQSFGPADSIGRILG